MNKKDRQIVFDKFGGKCYLCGEELIKGWHVDHLEPIRRNSEGCENPQLDCIENMMPACASCNINKHSDSLEQFRRLIGGFMRHLNEISTQYKLAKRYGLVQETNKPVVFYFETLKNESELHK